MTPRALHDEVRRARLQPCGVATSLDGMGLRWQHAGRAVGFGLALATGFAPALLLPLARHRIAGREFPVRLWVADRGGAALVGLDRELIVRRRIELAGIRAVAGAPEGGAWVLVERDHGGEVLRVAASGECLARRPVPRSLMLRPGPGGKALLFERDAAGRRPILLLEDGQRPRSLAELAGVRCADWHDSGVLLGTRAGELLLLSEAGGLLATGALGSSITAVAMDEDGSSWALDADGYLVRLDDRLRVLGRSWTATSGARLVGLGERRVALLDVAQGRLLVYASGGSLEWTREESYLVGLGTGVGWREGVLVTTPGALVVFDARGRSLPGQGGFVFLASAGHTSS